ncbi:MAG TPA: hypothetical protein VFZ48_05410 [Candidatus Saccharimonadales bacterium]
MKHTTVFDFASLGLCMATVAKESSTAWEGLGKEHASLQGRLIRLYTKLRPYLHSIEGTNHLLDSKLGNLRNFASKHGLKETFHDLAGDHGLAMATSVKITMGAEALFDSWSAPQAGGRSVRYKTIRLISTAEIDVFRVGNNRLFKIPTPDGLNMWLIATPPPKDALSLTELALDVTPASIRIDRRFKDLVMPVLNIDQTASLGWLQGMATTSASHKINQAKQRVKVEVGAAPFENSPLWTPEDNDPSKHVVLDKGLAGWFTDGHNPVPLATFYAGQDSWVRV